MKYLLILEKNEIYEINTCIKTKFMMDYSFDQIFSLTMKKFVLFKSKKSKNMVS